MDILLVLVGMLLGVVGTFGAQVVGRMYSDWRMKQRWVNAGKHWRPFLARMEESRIFEQERNAVAYLNPVNVERRLADLVSRILEGKPVDIAETVAAFSRSENRLPEHELEEHRVRLESRPTEWPSKRFGKQGTK